MNNNNNSKFSWKPGKAEGIYEGNTYAWTNAQTVAVFVDGEGWKHLGTTSSFPVANTLSTQRKAIREFVTEDDEDFLF